MSWLFSQALVEAFSEANCSDGEQSAQLNVMPTQHKFWRNDKTMEFSRLSQFGLTCAVLTESRGAELLTSYLAAFPVRTSAWLEREGVYLEKDQVYGKKCGGLLARFDLKSFMWKTAQRSLLEDLELSLEIWPRSGSMRSGVCWEAEPLAIYVKASESGFSLLRPTAQCWKAWTFLRISSLIRKNHADGNIQEQSARCFHKMITPESNEILMQWPLQWTALKQLGTAKYQQWQQQHSVCSQKEPELEYE
jgi:hypothetical protein